MLVNVIAGSGANRNDDIELSDLKPAKTTRLTPPPTSSANKAGFFVRCQAALHLTEERSKLNKKIGNLRQDLERLGKKLPECKDALEGLANIEKLSKGPDGEQKIDMVNKLVAMAQFLIKSDPTFCLSFLSKQKNNTETEQNIKDQMSECASKIKETIKELLVDYLNRNGSNLTKLCSYLIDSSGRIDKEIIALFIQTPAYAHMPQLKIIAQLDKPIMSNLSLC